MFTTDLPFGYPRSVDEPIFYRVVTIVDQMYAQQPADSVPDVQPQSHLMGARASDAWSFSVDGRQIVGQRVFFLRYLPGPPGRIRGVVAVGGPRR